MEAVTEAEAKIDEDTALTVLETEETESVLTTEVNDEEDDEIVDLLKDAPSKEPETKYRVRIKIMEASLIIDQVTEKSSLLMYLRNVTAKFHDKKGMKTFSL